MLSHTEEYNMFDPETQGWDSFVLWTERERQALERLVNHVKQYNWKPVALPAGSYKQTDPFHSYAGKVITDFTFMDIPIRKVIGYKAGFSGHAGRTYVNLEVYAEAPASG